ncbi:hypothetical protein KVQ88_24935, partial [Escherichia coli]|nr:hypothetical protein [Escherichia coli]
RFDTFISANIFFPSIDVFPPVTTPSLPEEPRDFISVYHTLFSVTKMPATPLLIRHCEQYNTL